jgi:hypothetical protein
MYQSEATFLSKRSLNFLLVSILSMILKMVDLSSSSNLHYTVLTKDEYNAANPPIFTNDFDTDGNLNHLDIDDDNDTVLTGFENTFDAQPEDGQEVYLLDTDGDGFPNFVDTDDDGDGYPTIDEDENGDGFPRNDDTDVDGHPDFLDAQDNDPSVPGNINIKRHSRLVGDKRYELSNHLGNVLSVITDRKIPANNIGTVWYGSDNKTAEYWSPTAFASIDIDANYDINILAYARSRGVRRAARYRACVAPGCAGDHRGVCRC